MKIFDLDAHKILLDKEMLIWFDLIGILDATAYTNPEWCRQN